jgi:hypothetical protein
VVIFVFDYLQSMNTLSSVERQQLEAIGAPTPLALRSAMQASPSAFVRLLGAKRYSEIVEALDAMVPEADKAELESADLPAYRLGVPVEHEPPPEIGRNALIEERDRVYQQIQQIKEAGDSSPDAVQLRTSLEERLNELLQEQTRAA